MEEFDQLPIADSLLQDLRSDHAGEAGAVQIYRGMLAVARSTEVRELAQAHLDSELRHLEFFEDWLPQEHHSRLLWMWRACGWLLGAVAALGGAGMVGRTIAAVEAFVEEHYRDQIFVTREIPALAGLDARLKSFCEDEIEHRRDAERLLEQGQGGLLDAWAALVRGGSAVGVALARRL
jgi:ubiquinone biosynthesis monooxygenase Coq7